MWDALELDIPDSFLYVVLLISSHVVCYHGDLFFFSERQDLYVLECNPTPSASDLLADMGYTSTTTATLAQDGAGLAQYPPKHWAGTTWV